MNTVMNTVKSYVGQTKISIKTRIFQKIINGTPGKKLKKWQCALNY